MPEENRDSVIITIFKGKADIQDCGKYRGIRIAYLSLLNNYDTPSFMKIFGKSRQ